MKAIEDSLSSNMRAGTRQIICLLAFVSFWLPAQLGACSQLSVIGGVGYEFISQEYFLDSLAEAGNDSLEAITALKTDYVDDLRARLTLKYRLGDRNDLEFRSDYDQTPEFIRSRLSFFYRPSIGDPRLTVTTDLDWRYRYADSTRAGDDYVRGEARAVLRIPLSESLDSRYELRSDFIRFQTPSLYSYDHHRIGLKAGLGKEFADFSMVGIDFFYLRRNVPDSAELRYESYGVETTGLGFHRFGDFDIFARLERKNYQQVGDQDDYWRSELDGRNQIRLGDRLFVRQELSSELNVFDSNDLTDEDYLRTALTLLVGRETGEVTLGLGGHYELKKVLSAETELKDDYTEGGIVVGIDYLHPASFFGSLESVLGRRNLQSEYDLQTDYDFERLNLIVDWTFLGGVGFNLLLSVEWEWHELEEENSRLALLTSGLEYHF